MAENLKAFLHRQSVKDLLDSLPQRSLVAANVTTTVEDALDILSNENVLSIPVYQMNHTKEYIAIVSTFDLLAYIAFQPAFDKEDVDEDTLLVERAGFLQHPIRELIGLSPESYRLHTISDASTLADLVSLLSRVAHRALVIPTASGSAVRIVTQRDLVVYLKKNLDQIGDIALSSTSTVDFLARAERKMSSALGNPLTHVESKKASLSITIHNTALVGFKKMFVHKVQAVAVVDDQGAIVGVLSASDLRGLKRSTLGSLFKPAMTFLTQTSPDRETKEPATCSKECNLAQCMEKLVWTQLHRLFIVDENGVPMNVVTLSDIISAFEEKAGITEKSA